MPTVRVRPAPVLLIVGCTPAFVRRCNEAAVQGRAIVVETDLTSFTTLATQTRARGVLMPRTMYATNAMLFDAMAAAAGTRLLTFADESIEHEQLVELIVGAVEHNGPDTQPAPSTTR
jgi:hypothetical protein